MTLATFVLADISLSTLVWWLIVGLIAGVLASYVMRGGYGIVGDIIIGILGAFIGGWLAGLLGLGASGLIGTIIIAFLGACVLIALLRALARATSGRRPRV